MKVKYRNEEHVVIEQDGLVMAENGKIVFGKVGEPLLCGEEVVEVVDLVLPTSANLVAEIKSFMDEQGIDYNSSDTKADLLQKIEWFYAEV